MVMKETTCRLHNAYGCNMSSGPQGLDIPALMRLLIGLRYRVEGILHEYLGPARLPDGSGLAHVFLRNEWRPNTSGQLPLTLVAEDDVDDAVTKSKIGRTRR